LNEKDGDGAESQTANLVTSLDGVHFERPNFGLFEFRGSKDIRFGKRPNVGPTRWLLPAVQSLFQPGRI
jgi:hypothetical protein